MLQAKLVAYSKVLELKKTLNMAAGGIMVGSGVLLATKA